MTGAPAKVARGSTVLIPVPKLVNIDYTGICSQYNYATPTYAGSGYMETVTINESKYFKVTPFEKNTYYVYGTSHCGTRRFDQETSFTIDVEPANVVVKHLHKLSTNQKFTQEHVLLSLPSNSNQAFQVCADGATASIFEASGNGIDYRNVSFKLRVNPASPSADIGQITSFTQTEGSLKATYKHPGNSSAANSLDIIGLDLVTSLTDPNTVLSSYSIAAGVVPLLMVHGLNSDSKGFMKMESHFKFLKPSGGAASIIYGSDKLYRVDYGPYSRSAFVDNAWVIPSNIDSAIDQLRLAGIAAGKVDIVGHSMGGILSRLYLQNELYRDDIHKLITLNTPHFGSQGANWLAEESLKSSSLIRPLLTFDFWYLCNKNNETCDAFNDLRVDSDAIRRDLNAASINGKANLNRNIVPSHAIVTISKVPQLLNQLLLKPVQYVLLSTTLENVFCGDNSDLIVAEISQKGGLSVGAYSTADNDHMHSGSMESEKVIARVEELLRTPTTHTSFSKSGFTYQQLTYNQCTPKADTPLSSSGEASSIVITSPVRGSTVTGNNQVKVVASGTNLTEIRTIVSYSPDSAYVALATGKEISQSFQIDQREGRRIIVVIGKTPDGLYVSDSTFFFVKSTDCQSLQTGDWHNSAVWSCGHEPTSVDAVFINPGHTITITSNNAQAQRIIYNGGKLFFTSASKLALKRP